MYSLPMFSKILLSFLIYSIDLRNNFFFLQFVDLDTMPEMCHGYGVQSIFLLNKRGFSHKRLKKWKLKSDSVSKRTLRYCLNLNCYSYQIELYSNIQTCFNVSGRNSLYG